MKGILYISILLVLFFVSCQNSSASSVQLDEKNQTEGEVENLFYYVEFINLDDTDESIETLNLLKKELFNNGYIIGKERNNDWQGIRKINEAERILLKDISKYHPNIHRFKDFSLCNSSSGDIMKIVISLNKPINDTIPNFNFRGYKKRGDKDWQSSYNPGNFRYTKSNTLNENDFASWMIRYIVLLTFK